MTRPNLPTLRSLAADPATALNLPLDALDALLTECDAEAKITAAAKRAITGEIERRYAAQIAAAYDAKGADTGTVRIADGGYEIVADKVKRVEWDQAALADIRSRIQFSGDDPGEYIKTSYAVDERAYTAWPAHIRDTFAPARTLKPGALSVKLQRKEAA